MRKRYESQADRDKEKQVSSVLETLWNCQLIKMPVSYNLDYLALRNGQPVAAVEMRHRSNKINKYPTFMFGLSKILNAVKFRVALNVPCFLVVVFTDATAYVDLSEKPDSVKEGGRTDRNDGADIEPVAHYRINQLTLINGLQTTIKTKD